MIREAILDDVPDITRIYNHYVISSHATFELAMVGEQDMQQRIERVQNEFSLPWLVSIIEGQVIGYAYATKWKARVAYQRTTETSVYIHHKFGGRGFGKALYQKLLDLLKAKEYHVIIGGISLPNDASIALHESLGFKKIGQFEEVGYKFDRWIDVGYWQLIFD